MCKFFEETGDWGRLFAGGRSPRAEYPVGIAKPAGRRGRDALPGLPPGAKETCIWRYTQLG